MSEGPKSSEPGSDTQEFEAVERYEGVDARLEVEMRGNHRLIVTPDFRHPIELRLGRDEQEPPSYLIPNPWRRERGEYVIVQPDVFRANRRRGWVDFGPKAGGLALLGRLVSPQFDFGSDVSRRHCLVTDGISPLDGNSGVLEIENYGRNGLRVSVHPDDIVRGMRSSGLESFDGRASDTWEAEAKGDPVMDEEAMDALRHIEEQVTEHPEINADAVDGMLEYLGHNLD